MIKYVVPVLFLSLTGCSLLTSQTKPVEVRTIAEPALMYHPPMPMELQLRDIEWTILTPQIMDSLVKDIEDGSAIPTAYYALTPQGYENLSENTAENKRYIRDIIAVVKYYRSLDDKEEPKETRQEEN